MNQEEFTKFMHKRNSDGNNSYINLYNLDIDHMDFTVFFGAQFYRATITDSVFRDSDFSNMFITDANFNHCEFEGCTFKHARMTGCNLSECIFSGVDMKSALFDGCNFYQSNFESCDLSASVIYGSNFSAASFADDVKMDEIFFSEKTMGFAQCCPERGQYTGFKTAG